MGNFNNANLVLTDVRMIFRNFAGKEGMYNREGDRNFSVVLDETLAQQMLADGWNVKWLKPREEGDPAQAYLTISVKYKNRPPRVVIITSRGRTTLTEDEVELLDYADIKMCDLIINPSSWAVADKSGIKAYLQSMFVTLYESELDLKYADVPEVSTRSIDE